MESGDKPALRKVIASLPTAHRHVHRVRMVERSRILNYAHAIAEEFKPEKIILFGSYACGHPTEDSDVDLLVVLPHARRNVEIAGDIRRRLRAGFAMDLLVRTPARLRERLGMGDSFMQEIVNRGEVLYERSES